MDEQAARAYEQRIMDAAEAGEDAPDVAPPDGYVMSTAFQEWLVERMRKEVLAQVSMAGLDRMAILRSKEEKGEDQEEE